MRKAQCFIVVAVVALTSLWVSCAPTIPRSYLQPDQMEDILYDYHLALGMLQQDAYLEDYSVRQQVYKLSVLRKHGVTENQFDTSLEYYMRHTEHLHEIYEHLAERLEQEAMAQGATESELNSFGTITAQGDTTDLWTGERSFLLMPTPPYHIRTFSLKADSTFHKGDRVTLTFDSQFIIQDGSRDGMVALTIRFNNDSTASVAQHVSTNSHQTIQLTDTDTLGIKEVNGMIFFNRGMNATESTLRLMFVSNIRLVLTHIDQQNTSNSAPAKKEPTRPVREFGRRPVGSPLPPPQQSDSTTEPQQADEKQNVKPE